MLGVPSLLLLATVWAGLYALAWWLRRRGVARADWHRDVAAIGVLGLATVGFFWPLFFTDSWIPKGGGDLSSFIYPTYAFAARWVRRGVIPLWNPHLYMGMPFAADNQSGLFYPLNLLFFLLSPQLTYEVVELMAVTHVFLAGIFAYVLVRDLPAANRRAFEGHPRAVSRTAAVAGAVAYMFSDLFVVHPGNLNIVATAAWLPMVLFCFQRSLRLRSWGWAGWTGVTLGIAALAGHAQMFVYIGMTLGLYALFEVYVHRAEGWAAGAARAGKLLLTAAIAFGVAALALVPAFDMVGYTVRASLTYAQASDFALPPAGLVSLFVPGFWGRGTGSFWGPWLRTEMGYVGVLPLVLAAIAVALGYRRCSWVRFGLALSILGVLIALGGYSVLHGWTYALIPFFRQLRVPARAMLLFDFAVALVAALGLDILLHPLSRRGARALARVSRGLLWIGGGLAVFGLPVLGHAMIVTRLSPVDVRLQGASSMSSVVFFMLLLGAGVGLLALRRHRLVSRAMLGALCVVVIAVDLISLGAYVETEPNDPLEGYRHDRELDFLRDDPGIFRVETATEVQGGWAPDWALIHEMDDLSGIWNPLRLGAYDVLTWVGIQREDRFYDLYNVKYLIARKDTPVPEHFQAVLEDGERTIYRNEHVLPRAFLVYHTRVAGGDIGALNIARAADFDPAREAVLKKGAGARELDVEPGDEAATVQVVERGPNHLAFRIVTPVKGYLFVSEMWLPGWVAFVDGQETPVVKANYTFRAVYLPAGAHQVRMVYRPRAWYVGLGLTLATLAGLAAWGAICAWRARAGPMSSQRTADAAARTAS